MVGSCPETRTYSCRNAKFHVHCSREFEREFEVTPLAALGSGTQGYGCILRLRLGLCVGLYFMVRVGLRVTVVHCRKSK